MNAPTARLLLPLFTLLAAPLVVACGQTATLEPDAIEVVREPDGRVTVRAKVYCVGAGDDDCETGGCLVASWSAAGGDGGTPGGDAGEPAIESDRACWTRTIRKSHVDPNGDHENVSVTSAAPIEGTPRTTIAVEVAGRRAFGEKTAPTPKP